MRTGIDLSPMIRDAERQQLPLPKEIAALLAEQWRDSELIAAQDAAKQAGAAEQTGRDRLAQAQAAERSAVDNDADFAAASRLLRRVEIALEPLVAEAARARDALATAASGARARERAWRESQAAKAGPILERLHAAAEGAMGAAAAAVYLHDQSERAINHRFDLRGFD